MGEAELGTGSQGHKGLGCRGEGETVTTAWSPEVTQCPVT